jgi:hypothetical protein
MKVLVFYSGSSSIKYRVFDMRDRSATALPHVAMTEGEGKGMEGRGMGSGEGVFGWARGLQPRDRGAAPSATAQP